LDAEACYDRIAPPIASFALQQQGATQEMINTLFDTVSNMKRSIRTIYGDSDLTYGHKSMKLHGILQGN
jgi:hypothetical protein